MRVVLTLFLAVLLSGCTVGPAANRAEQMGYDPATPGPTSRPSGSATEDPGSTPPTTPGTPLPDPAPATGSVTIAATLPTGLVGELCCLAQLPDGGDLLVAERHTGNVYRIAPDTGTVTDVGQLSGVAFGEGSYSVLGLAVDPDDPESLYVYATKSDTSEIDRYWLDLTAPPGEQIQWTYWGLVRDLPLPADPNTEAALAFGPDGTLYAGAAGGEIWRLETDGGTPEDNPAPGSLTYATGYGDIPIGMAWDAAGRGWSVDTAGALRAVVPGATADTTPPPLDAVDRDPSGLAHVAGSLWLGSTRANGGLWRVPLDGEGGLTAAPQLLPLDALPVSLLPADDGGLWILTADGAILGARVT